MTYFDTPFGDDSNQLPVEADRYRLIWAAPCPFASRAKITLDLLGLNEIISVGEAHPINEEFWQFKLDNDSKDPVLNVSDLKELYNQSEPNYEGPFSVPALVDIPSGKIIRKESADLVRDFGSAFKKFHTANAVNLYPEALQEAIDNHNQIIGNNLNSELYAIRFAESQEEYDVAIDQFFGHLKEIDARLETNRYYHGNQLTETDIFLFVILVRFAHVYYFLFDASAYQLEDYPHLWGYMRELYQIPAFGNNTQWDKIKTGAILGKHGKELMRRPIVPAGPDTAKWDTPHNRDNI